MAKEKTQILRYPYEALTDITDYFQINLVSRQTRKSGTGASSESFKDLGNPIDFNNKSTSDVTFGTGTNSLTNTVVTTDGIIILPMPSSIVDTNQVNYSDDSLDAITAKVAGLAGGLMNTSLFDANKNLDLSGALSRARRTLNETLNENSADFASVKSLITANLAAQAGSLVGLTNLSLNQVLARTTGEIVNPNMELLFNGPTIRNFSFTFKLTPREKKEAEQIKLIIRSLKKHMSPRNNQGLFLSSPHVFELRYKQGIKDHQYLHRFKRCALQNMSVNYTGENVYATYDDGAPVSTILSLSFKELEPIYAEDYDSSGKEGEPDYKPGPGGVGY